MQELVDLKRMTLPEKLRLMEALWEDLCQQEEAVPVHDWQKEILDEREHLIEKGDAQFLDWEESKKRIAKETS